MVLEFSISNFGPISEEQTLSFEATSDDTLEEYYVERMPDGVRILKLGMIYGPNASGKSTILKALEFLRELVTEPKSQKDEKWEFEKHLIGDYIDEPTNFVLIFVSFLSCIVLPFTDWGCINLFSFEEIF
jgi:AAA15 family ATPase/GTPase